MIDSPRLFCLDTVMMDIVTVIASLPDAGSDVLSEQGFVTTGGGFNAMSAAARQGMSVVYGGKLGTGPLASVARGALDREGIISPIEPDPELDLGFCVVMVDARGERTFVTSRGAEDRITASDLQRLTPKPGDLVLVSGYNVMYPGSSEMVLAWLESLPGDTLVAFDPSNRVYDIAPPLLERACGRADWILCNENEARILTGADASVSANDVARRARGTNAVLRRGGAGCDVVVSGRPASAIGAFPTDVRDTNGAGDTHNGVFLASLASHGDALWAARRANAAAAIAISSVGPATCPPSPEVDALLAKYDML